MKRINVFFILSFFILSLCQATVPEGRLFQFERSTNRNYICYDVNLKNGKLNIKEPVNAYWIRVEEGGVKKELSFLQFTFAFGYKVDIKKDNEVTIHLSPYKKLPIRICKRNGKWIALVTMDGQEMQLTKMFAQMKGDSLTCLYVDVTGVANGQTITKRIKNK
ncbi:MAG: DUF4833 domain-containing protein [Bacteroidaceae bacterium]|nr:DUF4833 domain-containing protein [Bacteroidaceae bacterium]